jgi:aconitase A
MRYGTKFELKNPLDINQAKKMAEEISAIQMSEKFQRLTYVNKISCRNKVDSEASSDEDMEEMEKKKFKVHQKDNEGPGSLSQKHKVTKKDDTVHGGMMFKGLNFNQFKLKDLIILLIF